MTLRRPSHSGLTPSSLPKTFHVKENLPASTPASISIGKWHYPAFPSMLICLTLFIAKSPKLASYGHCGIDQSYAMPAAQLLFQIAKHVRQ